jgi:hypothetical protein
MRVSDCGKCGFCCNKKILGKHRSYKVNQADPLAQIPEVGVRRSSIQETQNTDGSASHLDSVIDVPFLVRVVSIIIGNVPSYDGVCGVLAAVQEVEESL